MEEFKKEIIAKYFEGTCSPAEELQAIKWIMESESEFEVKAVMAALIENPDKKLLNSDQLRWSRKKIFDDIEKKIKIHRRTRIYKLVVKGLALAASWLVLFGLGLGWHQYHVNKTNEDAGFFVINAPAGSRTEVSLPDGSKVWLNASSQIRFSKNFQSETRDVTLIGEAYFDVAKNENVPFVVHTRDIKINVLGTAFNVRAYPDDRFVETTVERGLVTVERQNESGRQRKIVLKHNQQVRFENGNMEAPGDESTHTDLISQDKDENQPKIYLNKSIETTRYTSWIENILLFEAEPLLSLAKILERRHSVSIEILDENLKARQFTGVFEKESIEQALKALQFAAKFHFVIDKDQIIIDSKVIQTQSLKANNGNVRVNP